MAGQDDPCSTFTYSVTVNVTATYIEVTLSGGLDFETHWRKTGTFACPVSGTHDLTLQSQNGSCSFSSSTCSVTFS